MGKPYITLVQMLFSKPQETAMLAKSKYTILSATVLMFSLFSSPSMGAKMEISAYHEGQVGHPATVVVSVDSVDFEIRGFNLLLAVDQSSYVVNRITPGQMFEDCEWEYFTYRLIHDSAGSPTACCGNCLFHSNIHNSIASILIGTSTSP